MHKFLLNKNDRLSRPARNLPLYRSWLEDMPKTNATFLRSDVTKQFHVQYKGIKPIHLEFLGAWTVTDRFKDNNGSNRYVNPNYIHRHKYSDITTTCECGAPVCRESPQSDPILDGEHEHTENCTERNRLEAKERIQSQRKLKIKKLGVMGWHGGDICKRFGINKRGIGDLTGRYGLDWETIRNRFRTQAAETYHHLVDERGVPGQLVACIYDHDESTLRRWVRDYLGQSEPETKGFAATD